MHHSDLTQFTDMRAKTTHPKHHFIGVFSQVKQKHVQIFTVFRDLHLVFASDYIAFDGEVLSWPHRRPAYCLLAAGDSFQSHLLSRARRPLIQGEAVSCDPVVFAFSTMSEFNHSCSSGR